MSLYFTLSPQQYAIRCRRAAVELRVAPTALLKQFSVAIWSDVRMNFDRRSSPDGKPWRPLLFPRPQGGDIPLRNFGILAASATGGPRSFFQVSGRTLFQGTTLEKAAVHQFGATIVPVRGSFLTIPKTKEASRVRAREFPRPLVAIIGKRGGVLVEKLSRVVQYILTKRVVIPARPFMGFGPRLIVTINRLAERYYGQILGG